MASPLRKERVGRPLSLSNGCCCLGQAPREPERRVPSGGQGHQRPPVSYTQPSPGPGQRHPRQPPALPSGTRVARPKEGSCLPLSVPSSEGLDNACTWRGRAAVKEEFLLCHHDLARENTHSFVPCVPASPTPLPTPSCSRVLFQVPLRGHHRGSRVTQAWCCPHERTP